MRSEELLRSLDPSRVPHHVAIMADGNRRWGQRRLLPSIAGHRAGSENVAPILDCAARAGVEVVTLYVFSTENWGRAETEVSSLMSLFAGVIAKKASEVNKKGYRLRFLGRRDELPLRVLTSVRELEELTRDNEALDFYVALNYGGQAEIVDAARRIVGDGLAPEEIDAATFARYLYAPDAPPVDLLIRTSGELRVSNFLLWSIAYAEFYFTETLWPDFSPEEFLYAIDLYAKRSRRWGGMGKEVGGQAS